MVLNMETVMIANIIVGAVCLIVLLQLWYQNHTRYSGLTYWVADWSLLVVGNLLIALRGTVPNWASMVLSNSMIVGGTLLLYFGLCRFMGKKNNPFITYGILVVFAAFIFVHIYFTYVHNELPIRSYNVLAGLALACLLGVWLMFKGVSPQFRNISKGTGISFAVIILISIARIIGILLGSESSNDYFHSGLFDSLMVVLLAGATAYLTFNLVLMVNRRLYLEAKQMEAAALKSERELQATFKATTVGFAVLTNRVIKEVNEAVCTMMGYSRQEMIGNSTRIWYFTEEEYEHIWKLYDDVATHGTVSNEIRLRRKNGEPIQVIKNISALDKNNLSMGVVLSLIDITERKKSEDALKEELNIRANFINILAHELRSPLTPIMSSTEILKELLEKSPDQMLKRLVSNAYDGIQSLSSRLDDLLHLARYSQGAFTINTRGVDIAGFIESVASRYKPSLEQSGHTLVVDIADRLPEIKLDPSRMEQVLVNLLSNAGKYSPANTIIEVSVKVNDAHLLIDVKDAGKGLSETDQKSLFQPYHRLQQDRKNFPGLGLGLYICKQIVEAHGGQIQITSELGRGSTFKISLPLKGSEILSN
jgi:PAS domain S-box-containing protein